MSLKDKLQKVVTAAAVEAVQGERGRVLWLLDQVEKEIEEEVQRKLLVESERHAIEVKLKIFRSLAARLRRGIVSGVRPPQKSVRNGDDL